MDNASGPETLLLSQLFASALSAQHSTELSSQSMLDYLNSVNINMPPTQLTPIIREETVGLISLRSFSNILFSIAKFSPQPSFYAFLQTLKNYLEQTILMFI